MPPPTPRPGPHPPAPAAVSVVLAEIVGPQGRVIGVERDPQALTQARSMVERAGMRNVDLRAGDAAETGIPTGSVDVAMMRHVLAHNGGRKQAVVDHLAGLVRPAGCVYLIDVDLTAGRSLDQEPELEDLQDRYVEFHRTLGNDPSVGLRLAQFPGPSWPRGDSSPRSLGHPGAPTGDPSAVVGGP